jgi:hypothetical protein
VTERKSTRKLVGFCGRIQSVYNKNRAGSADLATGRRYQIVLMGLDPQFAG